jgi:hypothetical protein
MIMDEHQDELRDTPILRASSRRDAFEVPEGFFDRFPNAVQGRILETKGRGIWAWNGPAWAIRIAFMGSLSLVLGLAFWYWPSEPEPSVMAEDLEPVHPYELLDMELDDDLLFATLTEDGSVMNTVTLALSEREITAYVEYEDLSLELLIEEL